MKILFIQPTADKRGHYGVYTVNLCQELSKFGNEVCLFTNKAYPEKFISETPLFKIIEVKNGKYKFDKFDKNKGKILFFYEFGYIRNSFIILKSALRLLKHNHFDIVQIMDIEYGILSLLLKFYKRYLPPVVILINAANFSFYKYPGPILLRIYKAFQRKILNSALIKEIKAIVTLGEFHKEELKKQFNLPADFLIKVIYSGSSSSFIHLNKAEARRKLEINYNGQIFLCFGIIRKDKGIEYLLEACSNLRNYDFKILIAGPLFDYTENYFLSLINKWKLRERVILKLKYIEEKEAPYYFYGCDALVMPFSKIYTGGSNLLFEKAASYKIPVIATNVSEIGKIIEKYNIGLLAKPNDTKSLANIIEKFLKLNKTHKKKIAYNISKLFISWSKMAEQYLNLYKKLCR